MILVAVIYGVLVVRGTYTCDAGPCGPGQHWAEQSRSCVPCEDGVSFMDRIKHRCEACSRCKTLEVHERQTSKCNVTHDLESECLDGYRRRDDVCKKVMESTSAASKDAEQVTTGNTALESETTRHEADTQEPNVTTSAARPGEQSTMQESSLTPGVTAAVILSVLLTLICFIFWCISLRHGFPKCGTRPPRGSRRAF